MSGTNSSPDIFAILFRVAYFTLPNPAAENSYAMAGIRKNGEDLLQSQARNRKTSYDANPQEPVFLRLDDDDEDDDCCKLEHFRFITTTRHYL